MPIDVSSVVVETLIGDAALDPVTSALDAIAAHFANAGGIATALRGWPEHPRKLDLTSGPVVTVTFVDDDVVDVPPTHVRDTHPPLFRVGEFVITAQLDLWCRYRVERDSAGRLVEAALHNRLPHQTGLYLDSRSYHRRPLTVTASDGRNVDDRTAAAVGEWRRRWQLRIVTDRVERVDVPTQKTIRLRPTVQGVPDPDFDIS